MEATTHPYRGAPVPEWTVGPRQRGYRAGCSGGLVLASRLVAGSKNLAEASLVLARAINASRELASSDAFVSDLYGEITERARLTD